MGSLGKILHHSRQQAEGARQRFLQRILPLLSYGPSGPFAATPQYIRSRKYNGLDYEISQAVENTPSRKSRLFAINR